MSRNRLDIPLLATAVAITRFAFRSHFLYDIDSINFALGMGRFDPRVHQPHPPGYFLYICLGRLLNTVIHDANLALVILSIAASCGVVIVIYRMALEWFGLGAARFAGILFLLSPLAWFHGTVALTYSVEAFFSALLGFLCWRIECAGHIKVTEPFVETVENAGQISQEGTADPFASFRSGRDPERGDRQEHGEPGSTRLILSTAVLLGISAGVRPSSFLFLAPLFLYSLRHATLRRKGAGLAALLLTLLAWFLPMIHASGGFAAYFGALFSLWRMVPGKETIFNSSPANSIARAATIVFIYVLGFGAASLAPLVPLLRAVPGDRRKTIFTFVWIAPALCFFTFIFLKFVNSGYLLLLAAPACVWLGFWASQWYEKTAWPKLLKLALIGASATVNVLIFLLAPFYCSYRSVRRFEAELVSIQQALPQVAPPRDTLIIAFDSHFLGFRHAGYYLPGYLTVEYPQAKLLGGTRIFSMQGRDTRLLARLPAGSYSSFILFPLPAGPSFRTYLEKVESSVPASGLRTVRVGGHDFVTGPISDLPMLFPAMARAPERGVYALLHSGTPVVNSRSHRP